MALGSIDPTLSHYTPSVETLASLPGRTEIEYRADPGGLYKPTYNTIYETPGTTLSIQTEAARNGYALTEKPFAYTVHGEDGTDYHIVPGRGPNGEGLLVIDYAPNEKNENKQMLVRSLEGLQPETVTIGSATHLPIGRHGAKESVSVARLTMLKNNKTYFDKTVPKHRRLHDPGTNPLEAVLRRVDEYEARKTKASQAAGASTVARVVAVQPPPKNQGADLLLNAMAMPGFTEGITDKVELQRTPFGGGGYSPHDLDSPKRVYPLDRKVTEQLDFGKRGTILGEMLDEDDAVVVFTMSRPDGERVRVTVARTPQEYDPSRSGEELYGIGPPDKYLWNEVPLDADGNPIRNAEPMRRYFGDAINVVGVSPKQPLSRIVERSPDDIAADTDPRPMKYGWKEVYIHDPAYDRAGNTPLVPPRSVVDSVTAYR